MRYSFHGKVRATGQQVDGFVEAATASQAIDRLADRGIIGVYSVRPEAKAPKNSVILSGEAESEEHGVDQHRTERSHRTPAQPAPARAAQPAPVPHQLPAPQPVAGQATDAVLTQLVEKVSLLLAQVERLLSRPQQVIYQTGGSANPVRDGHTAKKTRMPTDMQNNTLRDIFQTNLDLRQSLEKLANTVGPAASRSNGEIAPNGSASKPPRESVPNGRDLIQAQPAA